MFYLVGLVGILMQVVFSQNMCWLSFDFDCVEGCICLYEYVFLKEGGFVVLMGNIVFDGCVVKMVGVDESIFVFEGFVYVIELQDEVVENILNDKVKVGDVVIVCYEGLKGGLGMQEMFYLISYIKLKGFGKVCVLLMDGWFLGGMLGLLIGYCLLEVVVGGVIGFVCDGDWICIDILNCMIDVLVLDEELVCCCEEQNVKGWKLVQLCLCKVFVVLKVYVKLVMLVDKGVVCDLLLFDD